MVDTSRADFDEIPAHVKERVDGELGRTVFDLLHAEAVKRGDLPAPPRTWFGRLPGRFLVLLLQIGLGAVVGTFAVIIAVMSLRNFATAI